MGPEKWKGERPGEDAAGQDREAGRREREAPREAIDDREEEGYSQPESSAQKAPAPGPGTDGGD
jgi:hypothetical protein